MFVAVESRVSEGAWIPLQGRFGMRVSIYYLGGGRSERLEDEREAERESDCSSSECASSTRRMM